MTQYVVTGAGPVGWTVAEQLAEIQAGVDGMMVNLPTRQIRFDDDEPAAAVAAQAEAVA